MEKALGNLRWGCGNDCIAGAVDEPKALEFQGTYVISDQDKNFCGVRNRTRTRSEDTIQSIAERKLNASAVLHRSHVSSLAKSCQAQILPQPNLWRALIRTPNAANQAMDMRKSTAVMVSGQFPSQDTHLQPELEKGEKVPAKGLRGRHTYTAN